MFVLLEHDGRYRSVLKEYMTDTLGSLTRTLNSEMAVACWYKDVACGQLADRVLGR